MFVYFDNAFVHIDMSLHCVLQAPSPRRVGIKAASVFESSDNQEGSDWRDDEDKLPGHENLTEKDIELFRHIQELALQVRTQR